MNKNMKYIIIILLLIGCSEDTPRPNRDCNCGTIANDGIDNGCYWLEIRNNCSGNKKTFCFDQDIWMDAYVGDNFCVYNETEW